MAQELKIPAELIWDARLPEADKKLVADLNASLARLDGLRAVKINVSDHFARSKIAWKLAAYQLVLLHRIVALADGLAIAWNNGNPLSAMLCARALRRFVYNANVRIGSRIELYRNKRIAATKVQ